MYITRVLRRISSSNFKLFVRCQKFREIEKVWYFFQLLTFQLSWKLKSRDFYGTGESARASHHLGSFIVQFERMWQNGKFSPSECKRSIVKYYEVTVKVFSFFSLEKWFLELKIVINSILGFVKINLIRLFRKMVKLVWRFFLVESIWKIMIECFFFYWIHTRTFSINLTPTF